MNAARAAWLDGGPDGRLHLQHGPIDLVIGIEAAPPARVRAFQAAHDRFAGLLAELVAELSLLKTRAEPGGRRPQGPVARRMADAVAPFSAHLFITPMAAVAGSVADEILDTMRAALPDGAAPSKIFVNNGGDIALHLAPGTSYAVGLAREDGSALGRFRIAADAPTRGIATSGRGGRSLSMGIADSVTLLAETAAAADAAATVIGNAVDLPGHPLVLRRPACDVVDDSDLGDRPVVVGLGPLNPDEVARALDAGEAAADTLIARGLAHRAALVLGSQGRIVEGRVAPFRARFRTA